VYRLLVGAKVFGNARRMIEAGLIDAASSGASTRCA